MMETQHQDMLAGLQQAVLQTAMEGDVPSFTQAVEQALAPANANANDSQEKPEKRLAGAAAAAAAGRPGPGRPPGVRNRMTNLRDAVLEAFDRVGGADYLVRLAEGTQSDRAAFTGLMAKILPSQIQAQVDGGIKLELSWLGNRQIGTTAAQLPEQRTQVLDITQDSDGKYRINDPQTQAHGQAAPPPAAGADAINGPTSPREG